MALLVLAIGFGATFYYWKNLQQSVQVDLGTAYARQTQSIGKTMVERMQLYQNLMRGSAGLVSINPNITQAEWEKYHLPYNVEQNFPDIEGIGVNRYLQRSETAAYLERRYSQGDTHFQIFPAGDREVYVPITFDARYTGNNGQSRGFDAFTDPTRKAAMEQSLVSNAMTLSGRVNLVSESRKDRSSFILYLPFYKAGMSTDTVEQRRAAVLGFVFIAIDAKTFTDWAMNIQQNPHLGIQVFDAGVDGGSSRTPAYESENFARIKNEPGAKVASATMSMYGHEWHTVFAASPQLLSERERQLPGQALWRGLITCIFFSGLVWYLITDRERKYARQKREEVQTAKDDLLSLASHQLRTPATVVKQYVGMLLQGYAGKLTSQQLDMLSNAYDSNERQLEIINQLLYVARLDAGRIRLHPRKTDITKMVRDVARDYSGTIAEREQQLSFRLPKRVMSAEVDPNYMRMVLENLLSNAIKYTPQKGSILIGLRRLPGEIVVSFKDSGVGIDPSLQRNIFEKFTRVDNELSNDVNGSGVGLYLTKKIIELHGGTIAVQSASGQGATFSVYIPIHVRQGNVAEQQDRLI